MKHQAAINRLFATKLLANGTDECCEADPQIISPLPWAQISSKLIILGLSDVSGFLRMVMKIMEKFQSAVNTEHSTLAKLQLRMYILSNCAARGGREADNGRNLFNTNK